jgi:Recombination enhancement, RecA-dependent nuclease
MTNAERRWMDAITQLGCIVCLMTGRGPTPAEPHHMLRGGRRMGHLFTIPLCPIHHRSGRDDEEVTSRDQCQRRFEARYGSEQSLLDETRRRVEAARMVA